MEDARIKKNLHRDIFLMVLLVCYITVLSGKIWQEPELEPEPKLRTKVELESEPKINNFGSATLVYIPIQYLPYQTEISFHF